MADTEHLDPRFWSALAQMIQDSGGQMSVVSGYRSVEEQTSLWNDAVAKYGSEDAARQWVAPPGHSNHNKGIAVDLGFSDGGLEWAHANAAKYGLYFPMEWEPWHIEPMGSRDGSTAPADPAATTVVNASPYTDPPAGYQSVTDPNRNFDLGTQLQRVIGWLHAPGEDSTVNGQTPAQTTTPPVTHPEIYS